MYKFQLEFVSVTNSMLNHTAVTILCSTLYITATERQRKSKFLKFKICQSVHRQTIPINQPTRCNNFSSLLLDVYVQLNMFWASSRPSSGAQKLQYQPLVLPLERGDNSAVGRGRAGYNRPTTTNSTAITTLQR